MDLETGLIERGQDTDDASDKVDAIQGIYYDSLKKLEELNQQKEKELFIGMSLFIPTMINALNKENISEWISNETMNDINKTLTELEVFNRIGDKYLEKEKDDVPF